MKARHALLVLLWAALPTMAEERTTRGTHTDENAEPAGFLTEALNRALDKALTPETETAGEERLKYGRSVTRHTTAPRFGGFLIGSYKYSSQTGKNNGEGFALRNLRMYVNGTVLRDFDYRVQVEMAKTIHLKDAYLEWTRMKEARIRLGQFKRPFTFENPYNHFDVGVGDFSTAVKKLSGFSDYAYGEYGGNNGGRDLGLQVQGDMLPVGKDGHLFIHYKAGVFNGQGINTGDANSQKDWIGCLQIQPIRGLYVAFFGWKGNLTINNVTIHRNRWAMGLKYDCKDWSLRGEYIHNTGHKISDYQAATGQWAGRGRADGWYATLGVPCNAWLKCYVKYDVYRDQGTNASKRTVWSLAPNIQLHKNLLFQLQYNHVTDRSLTDEQYNEVWGMAYIRF